MDNRYESNIFQCFYAVSFVPFDMKYKRSYNPQKIKWGSAMEDNWNSLSPEEKREKRFARWLSTEGRKFNSPEAEQKYKDIVTRLIKVLHHKLNELSLRTLQSLSLKVQELQ